MKKLLKILSLSLLTSTTLLSLSAFSAPKQQIQNQQSDAPVTLGKISLGGQSSLLGSGNYISTRIGINPTFNLNVMANLSIMGTSFSIGGGAQGEFIVARSKETKTYFGAGLMLDGIGAGIMTFSMVPSMGVEYFLTESFSADAAIGLPISLQLGSGSSTVMTTSSPFRIQTGVQPILGFHYYF